jgi:putative DNA primase/helicase
MRSMKPPVEKKEGKLVIHCKRGERHNATDLTQRALIAAGCPVYYRGGFLVHPLWRWEKTSENNRDALVTMIMKLSSARLSYMTGKHAAIYQKWNARGRKWEVIDPPNDVIEQLLELGHWDFPTIKGIVNSPTMRPDGSLLTVQGYDPETQLWFKSSSDIELPEIPQRPTRDDALRALELLTNLLEGFPFKDDISKVVAIAGLMTPVLRGAFEFAPLFLILAPEPGSGKSYLVYVIGTLATGRLPSAVPLTEKPEEMDKRLSAAAFKALPILHLNNLDFDLESALLCQMVTEGIVDIRPFGKNDQLISCDCRGTTIFVNGNNIRIVGDLVRRTLTARLDAKIECPETRTFKFDPVDYIKMDRGKYLAAVFTIVRAYLAAGCPKVEAAPLAGFDGWSRMVRQPLMWLGLSDPVKSMEDARKQDPVREALRQRIDELVKAFGIDKPAGDGALVATVIGARSGAHSFVYARCGTWIESFKMHPDQILLPKAEAADRSVAALLLK